MYRTVLGNVNQFQTAFSFMVGIRVNVSFVYHDSHFAFCLLCVTVILLFIGGGVKLSKAWVISYFGIVTDKINKKIEWRVCNIMR